MLSTILLAAFGFVVAVSAQGSVTSLCDPVLISPLPSGVICGTQGVVDGSALSYRGPQSSATACQDACLDAYDCEAFSYKARGSKNAVTCSFYNSSTSGMDFQEGSSGEYFTDHGCLQCNQFLVQSASDSSENGNFGYVPSANGTALYFYSTSVTSTFELDLYGNLMVEDGDYPQYATINATDTSKVQPILFYSSDYVEDRYTNLTLVNCQVAQQQLSCQANNYQLFEVNPQGILFLSQGRQAQGKYNTLVVEVI